MPKWASLRNEESLRPLYGSKIKALCLNATDPLKKERHTNHWLQEAYCNWGQLHVSFGLSQEHRACKALKAEGILASQPS